MKSKVLASGLVVLGIGLVFASLIFNSYNTGSCPAMTSIPPSFLWFGGLCDHTITFAGLTFWIRQTSEAVFGVGLVALIAGLAIGLYGMSRRPPTET